MEGLPDASEAAARARAAMHYAGFTYEELARESGVSYDLLRAIMGKTSPRGATLDRLYRVADACGVPRDFMLRGFETQQDDLEDRLQRIEAALVGLAAPGFRHPPGARPSEDEQKRILERAGDALSDPADRRTAQDDDAATGAAS